MSNQEIKDVVVTKKFKTYLPKRVQLDKECQTNIFFDSNEAGKTFICNRYLYENKCEVQIQTEIAEIPEIETKWIITKIEST